MFSFLKVILMQSKVFLYSGSPYLPPICNRVLTLSIGNVHKSALTDPQPPNIALIHGGIYFYYFDIVNFYRYLFKFKR